MDHCDEGEGKRGWVVLDSPTSHPMPMRLGGRSVACYAVQLMLLDIQGKWSERSLWDQVKDRLALWFEF